jgi:hypothetical protein
MASQSNPPLVSVVMQSDCPSAALTKIEILLAIIKAIDKTPKTSDIQNCPVVKSLF